MQNGNGISASGLVIELTGEKNSHQSALTSVCMSAHWRAVRIKCWTQLVAWC